MDEAQAIARLKRGEISGLEFLVRRHQLKAVRAAYLITRDRSLAEDIVQTAFLRVYERIHQFDSTRSFAPWFFRIVANDAIKAVTRSSRVVSLTSYDDNLNGKLHELLADSANDPQQSVEAVELEQIMENALATLSPDQRAAIVLRYYLDVSVKEMANTLDTSTGTIKWRLHAARQQLRRLFSSGIAVRPTQAQEDQS